MRLLSSMACLRGLATGWNEGKRGRATAVSAMALVALSACTDASNVPDVKQGAFTHDNVDYVVDYSVQEVKETVDAAAISPTEVRFDASFIQIGRVDGASMEGMASDEVLSIATAYCETHNLALAPQPGQVKYLQGSWLVERHCGGMFE